MINSKIMGVTDFVSEIKRVENNPDVVVVVDDVLFLEHVLS